VKIKRKSYGNNTKKIVQVEKINRLNNPRIVWLSINGKEAGFNYDWNDKSYEILSKYEGKKLDKALIDYDENLGCIL
jgi:hypothetical protein